METEEVGHAEYRRTMYGIGQKRADLNRKQFSSLRNYSKRQLIIKGTLPNREYLTQEEIDIVDQIEQLKIKLLDSWSKNTKALGFNVILCDVWHKGTLIKKEIPLNTTKQYKSDEYNIIILR